MMKIMKWFNIVSKPSWWHWICTNMTLQFSYECRVNVSMTCCRSRWYLLSSDQRWCLRRKDLMTSVSVYTTAYFLECYEKKNSQTVWNIKPWWQTQWELVCKTKDLHCSIETSSIWNVRDIDECSRLTLRSVQNCVLWSDRSQLKSILLFVWEFILNKALKITPSHEFKSFISHNRVSIQF